MAAPPLSPLAAEVRRYDRDRFVTTLFAPAAQRDALIALYAFNLEIARIRESVSEPLLGEIRLQWWRDALDKLYGGGGFAHPVVLALGTVVREQGPSRSLFERLIDGRAADLSDTPPGTIGDLETYADSTSAALVSLGLEVLGARGPEIDRLARHAGIGWGLVGILRAVPFHARTGRIYLPAELLGRHGVTIDDVTGGRASPGLAKIAEAIADRAAEHFDQARTMPVHVPRRARSPLLVTTLGKTYLRRLRAARFDLRDGAWSAVRPPMLRLALRSLTSGY